MLFERRWLQQAIDAIAPIVPRPRLQSLCDGLNQPNIDALHAMWEVAVIYAVSRCATVSYEESFGGLSRPDLLVRTGEVEFLVDVTSVSNVATEKDNPLEPFMEEFYRRVRKRSIKLEGFSFDIGSRWLKKGKWVGTALAIPHPGTYGDFFTDRFDQFLDEVRRGEVASFEAVAHDIKVKIDWEPDKKYIQSRYAGGNSLTSLERNSFYKKLRAKAKQLRTSGYDGIRGIVICDSGSSAFRKSGSSRVTLAKIVERFLELNSSVTFVVSISSRVHRSASGQSKASPEHQLFFQPDSNGHLVATITSFFAKALAYIPIPNIDAHNARGWQERHGGTQGWRHYGTTFSWHRENGRISMTARISARTLLDFLSGRLSYEDFATRTHLFPSEHVERPSNPFKGSDSAPQRLVEVQLIKSDRDDDWVEFSFEGPDPAANPLVPPAERGPI